MNVAFWGGLALLIVLAIAIAAIKDRGNQPAVIDSDDAIDGEIGDDAIIAEDASIVAAEGFGGDAAGFDNGDAAGLGGGGEVVADFGDGMDADFAEMEEFK